MVKLIIGDYVSKRIYRANDIRAKYGHENEMYIMGVNLKEVKCL